MYSAHHRYNVRTLLNSLLLKKKNKLLFQIQNINVIGEYKILFLLLKSDIDANKLIGFRRSNGLNIHLKRNVLVCTEWPIVVVLVN